MFEEIKNTVNALSNFDFAVYEGRCGRTGSFLPKRGRAMSMIEQLRGRIVPLNVREVADLLGVAESTVQRWVRNRELLAIRVADTIRFDPGVLADRLERFSISTVETQERTENGQGGGGLVLVSNTVDEG